MPEPAAPPHILAAASHLIAHNEGRLGKTLRTEDEPGEKVSVTGAWDSEEEARAVGEEIEELQRRIAEKAGYKLVGHRLELYGVPLDGKTSRQK